MSRPDSSDWYVAKVRPDGPFAAAEISRRFKAGEISADDWLWAPEPRVWIRVRDALKKSERPRSAPAANANVGKTKKPRQVAVVFRAWRLAGLAAFASLAMAIVAIVDLPDPPGILACGVFCVCFSWFVSECQGIRINAGVVIAPRRLAMLPAFYRRTTSLIGIRDMWLTKPTLGLPSLVIDAQNRGELLIFDSSSQRRHFVAALRTHGVDPQIHRLA